MRRVTLALAVTALACAPAKGSQSPAPAPAPQRAASDTEQTTRDTGQAVNVGPGALSIPNANPYPSTYKPFPSRPTIIKNVTLLTAAGPTIRNGTIVMKDGKIALVADRADDPRIAQAAGSNPVVIDGTGKYVTPGIIDVHSHLGVYAAPGTQASSDGNEATDPTTPYVWAEHSVWPQDPQFPRQLAGGVTTEQILPGSANLIGGRSAILKVVPSRTVQGMKFPGAKYGLKMACGENPKRVYQNRGPSTRMGNMAGYRTAWIKAEEYKRKWDKWLKDRKGDPPARDLGMETLAEVLRGNIYVHMHCYRADEMAQVIDMSHEFGYKVRAFHHGVEAYKIADLLAKEGIGAAVWADWGAFKMEAIGSVKANLALVSQPAGSHAMIHSDDASGTQRLNQEVAKAMEAGREAGINVTEDEAVKWMTINPAWALGLDDKIGSLVAGKNADVVLWSGDPFSVYTKTEKVWIDGALLFDRSDPTQQWRTDFELGYVPDTRGGSK